MLAVQLAVLALTTVVLGTAGIIVCLVVPGGRGLMPLARLWSRIILGVCRVRWRVCLEGRDPPSPPAVYVANHQSLLDIPALVLAMPVDFRIVAKRSLLYVPVFGWALWLAGFIFIERHDRERAIRSLDRAANTIRDGTSIVVFAEGTRSRDGNLLPFKKGGFVLALQAGVPVIPVSLAGGHAVLAKGSLRVRPGEITVRFGAPIETGRYSMQSKDDLIDAVRARIIAGLKRT
jgi:1-acyl-sn-glycerol-3-phosphate acyltransferase